MRLVGNDPNLQGGIRVKFFLDTADLAEIEEAASWGALAGVTANPSLYAKIGELHDFHNHMKRICEIVGPNCPVSAESVAMTRDEIVADGRKLAEIAPSMPRRSPPWSRAWRPRTRWPPRASR